MAKDYKKYFRSGGKTISSKKEKEDDGDKDTEKIVMDEDEFEEEHKNLVKILRSGSKKERMKEGKSQQKELDDYERSEGEKPGEEDNEKEMASGGGLKRSEDYGSKDKPYPSVKSGDFAGGHRSYPIPTKADAVDALRLAGMHGRNDVKSKVYAKYPDLRHNNGGSIYSMMSGEPFQDGGNPYTPENSNKDILSNSMNMGLQAAKIDPLLGLGVGAASFAIGKINQISDKRQLNRQEMMDMGTFQQNQAMNSTYADPNSVYYSAAEGARIDGDGNNANKPKPGKSGSRTVKVDFGHMNTPSTGQKKSTTDTTTANKSVDKMADGGSTIDKVKTEGISLFNMMKDYLMPTTNATKGILPKQTYIPRRNSTGKDFKSIAKAGLR
jgi:hypothetical protein